MVHIPPCVLLPALLAGSVTAAAPGFTDATSSLGMEITPLGTYGIDFGHGAAFVDVDGDGRLELHVIMGSDQQDLLLEYNPETDTFTDKAALVGCDDPSNGRGVAWADIDNDGDRDCFVVNWNSTFRLYQNNGQGLLSDVTQQAQIGEHASGYSVAWGDYNNDGWLDAYISCYGTTKDPRPNALYRNNGDGTFTDVAAQLGVDIPTLPSFVSIWIDYDQDGDQDLYVANDKLAGNSLFRNENLTSFSNASFVARADIKLNAMGFAVADYDHDGDLDIYCTGAQEGNAFLRNNGDGTFDDLAVDLGIAVNRIGWGCTFLDYDNDADDDLYVVNFSTSVSEFTENAFFVNEGDGSFSVDAARTEGVADDGTSFAVTTGDYNNDGFLDIFVNNQSDDGDIPSRLYRNNGNDNNWLKIRLEGTISNRDGIGAVVRVTTGGRVQTKDARSGSSFLSQLSPELEFGLGTAESADVVRITWPSGTVDTYYDVGANTFLHATEGEGLSVPVAFRAAEARSGRGGVELSWALGGDDRGLSIMRIYRGPGLWKLTLLAEVEASQKGYVDETASPGTEYVYQLGYVSEGGEVRSQLLQVTTPKSVFRLAQNSPNPFASGTRIGYSLPESGHARLAIFNVSGRSIRTLVNGPKSQGSHEAVWDGRDDAGKPVPAGIYFYCFKSGGASLSKRMLVIPQ